ncbi:MAG TPA: hypothetical protein VKX17_02740 [Planctomycetota bacterium]|nr:hypothetical protein [Planctomycetota bacterium]
MGTLPSGLPEEIADDEDLARFITQSNHYNAIMAKPAAFLPSKERETSVSRHGRDPLERLWQLGTEAANGRNLYGAAIFKAAVIRESKLEIVSDEPPVRHAVIRGWPVDNDPELQKAKQKELAIVLSAKSVFVRK